jgi:tyrosyl-tRNA synthetase
MGGRKKEKLLTIDQVLNPPSPEAILDKLHRLMEKFPKEGEIPERLQTDLANLMQRHFDQYCVELKISFRKQIRQIGKAEVFNRILETVKRENMTHAQRILAEVMLREIDPYKSEVKERMFEEIEKTYQESPNIRHHHLIQRLEQTAREEKIEVSKRQLRRYRKEFFFKN